MKHAGWYDMMNENDLSHVIIGAAIEVHRELGGPGLLESLYEEALKFELESQGLKAERQIEVPIFYKGNQLSKVFRIDLLVNDLVLVECKATEEDHDIYRSQCLTYLKLTDKRLGLVINFGQKLLKNGVHRVVNQLD
jgi:GxxExxY protein